MPIDYTASDRNVVEAAMRESERQATAQLETALRQIKAQMMLLRNVLPNDPTASEILHVINTRLPDG